MQFASLSLLKHGLAFQTGACCSYTIDTVVSNEITFSKLWSQKVFLLFSYRFGDSVPQCKKTKQKPRTNNPLFQEILVFSLEDQDVAEARLKLSIWDKDKISDDDFLGEVILELCKLDLEGRLASWYKLHPQVLYVDYLQMNCRFFSNRISPNGNVKFIENEG